MRIRTETASYVFDLDDVDAYVRFDSADPITATVPADYETYFSEGNTIAFVQAGAGALTIAGRGGVTINKAETLVLAKQFAGGELVRVGPNAWDFHGYATAA